MSFVSADAMIKVDELGKTDVRVARYLFLLLFLSVIPKKIFLISEIDAMILLLSKFTFADRRTCVVIGRPVTFPIRLDH